MTIKILLSRVDQEACLIHGVGGVIEIRVIQLRISPGLVDRVSEIAGRLMPGWVYEGHSASNQGVAVHDEF